MSLIKKHLLEICLALSIAVLYFTIRLPNLTLQPIFTDEAIYIRWAQVMRSEPTLRYLPLTDGKTPLFMWMMMPLFKLFNDPLFAGRILSVFSGFLTLIGIFVLARKFFDSRVALMASLLVAVTPLSVFFDRMALVDSLFAASFTWALFIGLLTFKYLRIDLAMVLGYLLGGSMLVKTTGIFNFLSLPAIFAIFNWNHQGRQGRLLKTFLLLMLSVVIGLVIYNSLRLFPEFDKLSSRNQDYVFSPLRLLQNPLDPFIPHLNDLVDWFPKLLGFPLLLLIFVSPLVIVLRRQTFALAILLWSLVPLLIEMALLKTFTARYILFCIPPLYILASLTLFDLSARFKKYRQAINLGFIASILIFALWFDITLIKNPAMANLPLEERRGYLEDWTAGYNFPEIAQFLINEARKEPIIVGTEGSFGTLPDGLYIYLDKVPNISVSTGVGSISAKLYEASKLHPTFYVSNKSRFAGAQGAQLLKEYPKAKSIKYPQDAILLFKVSPLDK